jgi:hypothetical protein
MLVFSPGLNLLALRFEPMVDEALRRVQILWKVWVIVPW